MFGGNMQGMMKKVQKMQKEMKKLQDDLKKRTVEATVGGGVLTIVMNGEKNVESVTHRPEHHRPGRCRNAGRPHGRSRQ